jgi:hypothetical protein
VNLSEREKIASHGACEQSVDAPAHFRGAKGDSRFVILTHDHPFLHWDLMLEDGDALTTFRLLQEPATGVAIAAEALAAHRKAYLNYEGPVSGGRGTVTQWDRGTCEPMSRSETKQVWRLWGSRIKATITLKADGSRWSCRFEHLADDPA